jgi:hypothetical protein
MSITNTSSQNLSYKRGGISVLLVSALMVVGCMNKGASAGAPAAPQPAAKAADIATYAIKFKPQFLNDHQSIKPEAQAALQKLGNYVLEFADFGPNATATRGLASLQFPQISSKQGIEMQKQLLSLQLFEYVELPRTATLSK